MPKENETTTKFKVDISELRKGMQEAKRQIALANSEFKAASAGMDNWGKSADGLSAKLSQLDKTMAAQQKILDNLETEYRMVADEQGENSKAAQDLLIKINNQKAAIGNTQKQITKYTQALAELENESDGAANGLDDVDDSNKDVAKSSGQAAKGIDDVGDAADKAEKNTGGLGSALGNLAKTGFAALAGAATAAVGAFMASAEATRELRTNMAKVETAFTTAGFQAETATDTYKDFYAVLGDEGQATEAVNHLAKLCDTEQDLADWTEIATGVYGTFGDSLPIEGLTEAANETAKVGQVTGPLADALNWAGISEDEFNDKLAACNSEQERAQLITSTLKGEYEDAAKTYEETAGDIMDAQRAQAELNDAMAGVGAVAEPVMTSFKLLGAEMLNSLLPGLEEVGAGLTDLMNGVEGAETKVGDGLSNLLTGILDKIVEMLPKVAEIAVQLVITFVQSLVEMLPTLVTTAGEIILTLTTALTEAIPQLIPSIVKAVYLIIDALVNMMPQLMQAGIELFSALINALVDVIPDLIEQIDALVTDLVYGLLNALPQLLDGAITLFTALVDALPIVIDALLKELPNLITMLVEFLVTALPQIIDAAITLFMALVDAIPIVINVLIENLPAIITAIVNGLIEAIPQILAGAIQLFMAIIKAIPTIVKAILKAIPQLIVAILKGLAPLGGKLLKFFGDAFKKPLDKIKEIWSTVSDWFKEKFNAVVDGIKQVFTPIIEFFKGIWDSIKTTFQPAIEWFSKLFSSIWATLKSVVNVIIGLLKGMWVIIKTIFGTVASWFNDKVIKPVARFFKGLWDGISGAAKTAWDAIKKVFEVVSTWFNDKVIKPVVGFFSDMWNKLKTGASNAWQGVKDVFSKVADFFGDIFGKAWSKVKDIFSKGGKIFDGIKEGIGDAFKTIVNTLIRGINTVVAIPFKAINTMLNKIRDAGVGKLKPFKGLWDNNPISIPEIPQLYDGTVVKRGRQYLLEGRGDEAVVPLHNNKKWIRKTAQDLKASLANEGMLSSISGKPQTVNNNYNFTQNNTSPKALSRLEIYRQTRNQLNFAKGV